MKQIKMNKKFIFIIGCLFFALVCSVSRADDKVNDDRTYIIGHWNYPENSVIPVYVISEGDDVELFINGISNGHGRKESNYLFTFDNVIFQPGTLTAVSYDDTGKEQGSYSLVTSGVPAQIKLAVLQSAQGNYSDESDEAVIQCEITDFYGRRCLHDNRTIIFEIEEPSDWINVPDQSKDPYVNFKQIQLHKGENTISVKKPLRSGETKIKAKAQGLAPSFLILKPEQ